MQTIDDPTLVPEPEEPAAARPAGRRTRGSRRRRFFMRPRKVLVRIHRWLGIGLFLWLCVIGLTGAWLAESNAFDSWLHGGRYEASAGDVGPDAAMAAATEAFPEGAFVSGLTAPGNARGVYQVYGEVAPAEGEPEDAYSYFTAFVNPGTGEVNGVQDESAGVTAWLYRGHEYLWQDHGIANAFGVGGWCAKDEGGHEPGGVKGVACDVTPDGLDMVGWFAVGFMVLLLSGFYLWYWPGVRRWATAFVVRRGRGAFTFNLSLHRVVGFVVWIPLLMVTFTGAAFAFPNMEHWFDNATPAHRDFYLWEPADEIVSEEADGREPIGMDEARAVVADAYPSRTIHYLGMPYDETGTFSFWVSRGFDPWTREGGAGNTYVWVDQFSGKVVYDGTPEDGNTFDQAWDDWSFPLHTGDFGGAVTRILWVFLGLSPLVLGVTGLLMQLIRRRKRSRRTAPTPVSA